MPREKREITKICRLGSRGGNVRNDALRIEEEGGRKEADLFVMIERKGKEGRQDCYRHVKPRLRTGFPFSSRPYRKKEKKKKASLTHHPEWKGGGGKEAGDTRFLIRARICARYYRERKIVNLFSLAGEKRGKRGRRQWEGMVGIFLERKHFNVAGRKGKRTFPFVSVPIAKPAAGRKA